MPKQTKGLKPGTPAPESGQYARRGQRGGKRGDEVTMVKGDRLPPTPKPGETYDLVDKTKHKGSR
jgi:hypothetical protein